MPLSGAMSPARRTSIPGFTVSPTGLVRGDEAHAACDSKTRKQAYCSARYRGIGCDIGLAPHFEEKRGPRPALSFKGMTKAKLAGPLVLLATSAVFGCS